jgi:hypothetical protein
MFPQALDKFLVFYMSVSDVMLAGPFRFPALVLDFGELACRSMALWTLCGRIVSFMDITADQTSEFLFHNNNLLKSNKLNNRQD